MGTQAGPLGAGQSQHPGVPVPPLTARSYGLEEALFSSSLSSVAEHRHGNDGGDKFQLTKEPSDLGSLGLTTFHLISRQVPSPCPALPSSLSCGVELDGCFPKGSVKLF